MKGLELTASVASQVVEASRKAPARSGPSGSAHQASVAQAASVSSVSMPAAPISSRWRREGSFQASLVSVYNTGTITRKATPIAGTRQPKWRAVNAWPNSCDILARLSDAAMPSAAVQPP